jgi:nicotinamidase-related amidase
MNPSSSADILSAYREKGLAGRVGYGERPALLVVDLIRGFTTAGAPLAVPLDAVVESTVELLGVARAGGVPVIFTTTAYSPGLRDAGLFVRKVPALAALIEGSPFVELDPRLGRRAEETLIEKKYASAFFGTPLASLLQSSGLDTLLVAGCTTSGCIRATVVDALQHGFRAIVPQQCVGDRAAEPHHGNLLDIQGKYGDVVEIESAIDYLAGRSPGR